MKANELALGREGQPDGGKPPLPKVNWWLRLTSTGWNQPQETIEQRERARRSRLTSWIILGLLVMLVVFVPAGLQDPASLRIMPFAALGVAIATALNRFGFVGASGILLVVMISGAIFGVLLGAPHGQVSLVYLPIYDILAVPVVIGASILPRISSFLIAAANIALVYADLLLQPKADDLQQQINIYGLAGLAGRPTAVMVIIAVVAYLWVRGMDGAVRRADRAEELRAMEQHFAEIEARQADEVRAFIQEIINAIGMLANGQEGLVLLPLDHPFYKQAMFINGQLKQFHKLKQANKGIGDKTAPAAGLLLNLLQRMNAGQANISMLDPQHFSTQVVVIDEIAGYLYYMLQGKRVPPMYSEARKSRPHVPNR
jgi:hypothetical protein